LKGLKTGIDYFPFDVGFFEDEKLQFISAKFGCEGELTTIKLLCKIYRIGYFIKWGPDECILFSKYIGLKPEIVEDIVEELLKRDFFSQKHFKDYSILTSNGIQKRFLEATRRRKLINMHKELLIADISDYIVNIIPLNGDIYKQSKVKQSKVNKTTPYSPPPQVCLFETFWKAYPKKKNKGFAEKSFASVLKGAEKHGSEAVEQLMSKILASLERNSKSTEWLKDSGRFIPYPATWLNARGWEDEIQEGGANGRKPTYFGNFQPIIAGSDDE